MYITVALVKGMYVSDIIKSKEYSSAVSLIVSCKQMKVRWSCFQLLKAFVMCVVYVEVVTK